MTPILKFLQKGRSIVRGLNVLDYFNNINKINSAC